MKIKAAITLLVVVFALVLSGCGIVGTERTLIVGGSETIQSGEVLTEPLTILGGNVTMEAGSRLNNELFVLGGNATVDGEIDRDVHIYGGNLTLGSTAIVHGSVYKAGGNVTQASGARIDGEIVTTVVRLPVVGPRASMFGQIVWFVFRTAAITALAVAAAALLPAQTERVARTATTQPLVAGAVGLVGYMVAPIVLIVLAITIIGIPFTLLGILLLFVAGLFSWIALGLATGRRLGRAFDVEWHPVTAAGIGTLVFTLIVDGIGLIPWIGWIAPFLAAVLGFGAVILTRFGTRPYMPATDSSLPPTAGERPATV